MAVEQKHFFDTLSLATGARTAAIHAKAAPPGSTCARSMPAVSACRSTRPSARPMWRPLWGLLAEEGQALPDFAALAASSGDRLPVELLRQSAILSHPIFNRHHSETELMRYLRKLADKDLALDRTMIPLGSCTMKLNAASEMIPVTWAEFGNLHPFAPAEQSEGYRQLTDELEAMLCSATGYDAVSLQPNAGSQGEVRRPAGDPCLPPEPRRQPARHLSDPVLRPRYQPGYRQHGRHARVVVVACDARQRRRRGPAQQGQRAQGTPGRADDHLSVHPWRVRGSDPRDLRHRPRLRRPGVHRRRQHERHGRPVRPGKFGGDVSHLNLHKTFCIPHGGGGRGVGPIGVRAPGAVPPRPALAASSRKAR
ncbi:hypothetical protein P4200_00065 [Pseudomonas aeruginosa]|nr:hypothetical protein [Pseudomonas aeruginosa]